MGGNAFNSSKYGNLPTPRIPNKIHHRLLIQLQQILSQYYKHTSSPIPQPEKSDHGDIDILVEEPLSQPPVSAAELQRALNATAVIEGSPTSNFAIWDDKLGAYAQLDIHVCMRGGLEWECFHHAYGDLWNILGVMGKPFGVSVNGTGLRISVQGAEARNHKAGMMLLTSCPKDTIEFFGCDWDKYEKGFKTVDELFSFCAGSRFLYHHEIDWSLIGRRDERKLKETRPLYRRWITEYLPKFDKWDEYNKIADKWDKEEFDKEMWRRIATALPVKHTKSVLVIRRLKTRLEKEDKELSVQGFNKSKRLEREIRWTAIALSECKDLLEKELVEIARRREEGVKKSQENKYM